MTGSLRLGSRLKSSGTVGPSQYRSDRGGLQRLAISESLHRVTRMG